MVRWAETSSKFNLIKFNLTHVPTQKWEGPELATSHARQTSMEEAPGLRPILHEIADLLQEGGERFAADQVRAALSASDERLRAFVVSNDLWGGAGSIADQSLIDDQLRRHKLEDLLGALGRIQVGLGSTNPSTEMWLTAFTRPAPS